MKTSVELANRFREVILNGRWIANTNYKHLLEDINLEQATKKVGNLNTIAALTFHINYYIEGVLNVFKGGDLEIRDKYSFDFPELTSEFDWEALKTRLFNNSKAFASHVEQMSTEQLNAVFVDEKYGTYQRNIEGIIEHSYYHLGQVSLIKKLVLQDQL
ncbi:DinB family protein [Winogradskyella sp. 3972H.M.0a.05]|uniref:DinB family protein n=1 Tax=Winogradskyella sp. 3972H.M.0a.05 TaxID=2950277 RepID=UPI003399A2E2